MASKKIKLPPTLIIGLGGKGCSIVKKVHDMTNEAQRKFIRFVFFDTDANELRQCRENAPDAFTIQTSRNMTAGQALRIDPEARLNTFPINQQVLNKPMTEGAGQIRALSKLAFDATLREGRIQPLHDAVGQLLPLTGEETDQAMRVMIVATICGGTGSGLFLPLSMYLRHYLETNRQQKPIIRGFCVLPGIFSVNSSMGEVEKENLRTNAYAALREIDAFMLRSDSENSEILRNRYRMKMPRPGTIDQYDDYNDNPIDFCYLFDGQNMDGSGLDTMKDYVQHAADCIYAASISKLNTRLNSSEDNTVLSRIRTSGRNRYCGIGASKIVYPFVDINKYIAYDWMKQATSKEWLKYDEAAKTEISKRNALRASGVSQPELDERDFYCRTVDANQEQRDNFSLEIIDECYKKGDDGITNTDPLWEIYYGKIKSFIDKKVEESTTSDKTYVKKVDEDISQIQSDMRKHMNEGNVSDFTTDFNVCDRKLKSFYSIIRRNAENSAGIISGSLFAVENYDLNNEERLEHWLMTKGDVPMHPNSVRYFLYNLKSVLDRELLLLTLPPQDEIESTPSADEDSVESLPKIEKDISDFFNAESFSIDYGNGHRERVKISNYVYGELGSPKYNSFVKKKEWKEKVRGVINRCTNNYESIKRYYGAYIQVSVLKKAISFIEQLYTNYETLFNALKTEITHIPREMQKIEETYESREGNPIKYACASEKCLSYFLSECANTIGTFKLTDEFRKKVFTTVFNCMTLTESKQHAAINDLVSNDIIEFWRGEVLKKYSKVIDLDVVSALCLQNEIENDEHAGDFEKQKHYIERVRDEALKLASPFIDKPGGREPHIIRAYGTGSEAVNTDNTVNAMLYSKVLSEVISDDYMDKYQVVFMNAVYDLSVKDLHKFAPEDRLPEDPIDKGIYYKAYRARIEHVLPDSRRTREMTPHLDKTWHYIGVLPDLDDRVEVMDVKNAQKAFFYSVVMNEYIHKDNEDKFVFLNENRKPIKNEIDVSDGKCDKFHEIYEAMLRSRPLIKTVIDRFEKIEEKEQKEKGLGSKSYKATELYINMNTPTKKGDPLHYSDKAEKTSYIEIPILYKVSTGNSMFDDECAMTMFQNMTDTIEEYLKGFYGNDKAVCDTYFAEWFGEQTMLMLKNVSSCYSEILENPLNDSLFKNLANVIIAKFNRYEYCDEAAKQCKAFKEEYERLTSGESNAKEN